MNCIVRISKLVLYIHLLVHLVPISFIYWFYIFIYYDSIFRSISAVLNIIVEGEGESEDMMKLLCVKLDAIEKSPNSFLI